MTKFATMQKSKIIMQLVKSKYTRAYQRLDIYLKNSKDFNCTIYNIEDVSFKSVTALLYSFFDDNSILVSVYPEDVEKKENRLKCNWTISIFIEKEEIKEYDLASRETAEFVAFQKAFQFLDTKLFIELTKDRFYDESSDSCCLNMNWVHVDKVLTYRRKNLISYE